MPSVHERSPESPPAAAARTRVVLIPYSRVGGGHQSIATALAAAIEGQHPGAVVAKPTDVYLEHGRFPVTLFPRLYAGLVRRHPVLWSLLFRLTNTSSTSDVPTLNYFLSSGIMKLL